MPASTVSDATADARFRIDAPLVQCAIAATRAAALAAAAWAGRGDSHAADGAATSALRAALRTAESGIVVSGEGAKDGAPMLEEGELTGRAPTPSFDIAVDPLECTDLCARGLPGALSTLAVAPHGSLWSPGPAFYMDKLVLPPAARGAASISSPPEVIIRDVAVALGKRVAEMRVVVLDKPRHRDLVERLRAIGAIVITPPAGDVAGALSVLLPQGDADVLLGIGGAPEGILSACAVRALGGEMQGRIAPQLVEERERVRAAGLDTRAVLGLDDLVRADSAFVATGVTGGLLAGPHRHRGWVTTESLAVAAGTVTIIRQSTPLEED